MEPAWSCLPARRVSALPCRSRRPASDIRPPGARSARRRSSCSARLCDCGNAVEEVRSHAAACPLSNSPSRIPQASVHLGCGLLQESGRRASAARHIGSQYEIFTKKTSLDGALRSAEKSRRSRKLPIGSVSDRFSFHTTYKADPGRNSQRTTALPRRLRKAKSGLLSYANGTYSLDRGRASSRKS